MRIDIAAALLLVRPVLAPDLDGEIIHDPNSLTWRGLVGVEAVFR
jgi:hypothetical protein